MAVRRPQDPLGVRLPGEHPLAAKLLQASVYYGANEYVIVNNIYIYIYVFMYVCMYVCVCVRAYVRTYVCMYVCVCMCV